MNLQPFYCFNQLFDLLQLKIAKFEIQFGYYEKVLKKLIVNPWYFCFYRAKIKGSNNHVRIASSQYLM